MGAKIAFLVPAVFSDVEIFIDTARLAERVEGVFGEWCVEVVEFKPCLDASVHTVGAPSGIDGDLAVNKRRDGAAAVRKLAIAWAAVGIGAELDGKSGGRLFVRE